MELEGGRLQLLQAERQLQPIRKYKKFCVCEFESRAFLFYHWLSFQIYKPFRIFQLLGPGFWVRRFLVLLFLARANGCRAGGCEPAKGPEGGEEKKKANVNSQNEALRSAGEKTQGLSTLGDTISRMHRQYDQWIGGFVNCTFVRTFRDAIDHHPYFKIEAVSCIRI